MRNGSQRQSRAASLPLPGGGPRTPPPCLGPAVLVLALLPVLAWASVPDAQAHGTGSRLLPRETVLRAVLFHYSTGDPMSWTGVRVFAPDGAEWVQARTDAAGVAAFAPDRSGLWRIQARDEEGHQAEAEVVVDSAATAASAPHSSGDGHGALWPRVLLGLSLLANVFLALVLRRSSQPK